MPGREPIRFVRTPPCPRCLVLSPSALLPPRGVVDRRCDCSHADHSAKRIAHATRGQSHERAPAPCWPVWVLNGLLTVRRGGPVGGRRRVRRRRRPVRAAVVAAGRRVRRGHRAAGATSPSRARSTPSSSAPCRCSSGSSSAPRTSSSWPSSSASSWRSRHRPAPATRQVRLQPGQLDGRAGAWPPWSSGPCSAPGSVVSFQGWLACYAATLVSFVISALDITAGHLAVACGGSSARRRCSSSAGPSSS